MVRRERNRQVKQGRGTWHDVKDSAYHDGVSSIDAFCTPSKTVVLSRMEQPRMPRTEDNREADARAPGT